MTLMMIIFSNNYADYSSLCNTGKYLELVKSILEKDFRAIAD